MGKGPKAPDPYAVADAQTQSNQNNAWYNAIIGNANETNPYGSMTYTNTGQIPIYGKNGEIAGYAPQFHRNIQLNPEQQKLLDLQNATMTNIGELGVTQSERMQDVLGKPVDFSDVQAWGTYGAGPKLSSNFRQDATPTDRPAVEKAIMSRIQDDAAKRNAAQDVQLAAQGMTAGTEGYGGVQDARGREMNDAWTRAYLASGEESRASQDAYNTVEQAKNAVAQQGWQNTYTQSDAQNKLRGAQVTEKLGLRNQDISEIMSLLGMSGPTTPQFSAYNAPSAQAAPIGQYIYDKYNADSQAHQAKMQGLFGLAGNALGLLTAPMGGAGSMFGGTLLGSMFGR
jgi:hypothetical protein